MPEVPKGSLDGGGGSVWQEPASSRTTIQLVGNRALAVKVDAFITCLRVLRKQFVLFPCERSIALEETWGQEKKTLRFKASATLD